MEVGHRDLGRGDQVQLVARDDVHLVLLVRDLPGAARRSGIDDRGRPDLREAVLDRVRPQEEVDEGALEGGPRGAIHGEPGAGDLGAALQVQMRSRSATSQCGSRSHVAPPDAAPALLSSAADTRRGSTSPQVRTVTLSSGPPTGTSGSAGFGMRSSASSRSASIPAIDKSSASMRSPTRVDAARSSATSAPCGSAPPRTASPIRFDALLRSAFRLSLSARSVRRRSSSSSARSTSAGSSRLSMAPRRMTSGSARSRCSPTLMRHLPWTGRRQVLRPGHRPSRRPEPAAHEARVEPREEPAGARPVGPAEERRVEGGEGATVGDAALARGGEDQALPRVAGSGRVRLGGGAERRQEGPLRVRESLDLRRHAVRADGDAGPSGAYDSARLGRRGRAPRASAPPPGRADRPSPRRRGRRCPRPDAREGRGARTPAGTRRPTRGGRSADDLREREDPLGVRGSSPFTCRPAVAAARRSSSSKSRGMASVPSGSNSIAWLGAGPKEEKPEGLRGEEPPPSGGPRPLAPWTWTSCVRRC